MSYTLPNHGDQNWDVQLVAAIQALDTVDQQNAANLTTHANLTTGAHGGIVASTDVRLSDARTPLAHVHAQSDITGLSTSLGNLEPKITAGTSSQFWRGDKTFAQPTSDLIAHVPDGNGSVSSTNVAAAIAELDVEKSAVGHTHALDGLASVPSGLIVYAYYTGGAWPTRPTTRTDIACIWITSDNTASDVPSGGSYAIANLDVMWRVA